MTAQPEVRDASVDSIGIELLAVRPRLVSPVDALFRLHPGDRSLVNVGEAVTRGQAIVEHHRDPRTIVVSGALGRDATAAPGDRWTGARGRDAREGDQPGGELLFRSGGR